MNTKEFSSDSRARWEGDTLVIDLDSGRVNELFRDERSANVHILAHPRHGFAPYRRKFSLNTWLVREGYLVLKPGKTLELADSDPAHEEVSIVSAVDWSKSRAYGVAAGAPGRGPIGCGFSAAISISPMA